MGYEGIKWVFTQIHTGSIQCLCTYIQSYLASVFSPPTLCVACIVMPHLNIDTARRAVFLESATGYLVHKL